MALGPRFINYRKTLFGNARAKISVNGHLTNAINLKISIRQCFPLASLLFSIDVLMP